VTLVYGWCVERIDPNMREEWEAMLVAPIPGREKQASPQMIEDEGEAFMAMMQYNEAQRG